MSHPRSRSPLYSRNETFRGRRGDGFYDEHHSDSWRNPENGNKLQGNSDWDNGPSQGAEEVDHWAKFIEAIGRARRRRASPMSRYHEQDEVQNSEEKLPHSPGRRPPKDRLPFPEASYYGGEARHRMPSSPGRRRNDAHEQDVAHLDRPYADRTHRDSSDRHSHGKRHGRMEHGFHNEEREDRYYERNSFSERSSYREHHPHPKRLRGMDIQEDYSASHRGSSPHDAPVVVEHNHGFLNRDRRGRDPPRSNESFRNQEHPRNRDPPRRNEMARDRGGPRIIEPPQGRDKGAPRTRETSRNREPFRHRREDDHHTGLPYDGHRDSTYHHVEEERLHHSSVERRSPMRGRSQHQEQFRREPHAREQHGRVQVHHTNDNSSRSGASGHAWVEETQPGGSHGGALDHHRNPITNSASLSRMDFSKHETLRIQVDMSRPVGHSSHLGYSSERQLSLDLVNVGRQRLDFLPMLEHSGTYRESAIHSGTFAQEVITLVHHVKENYFQGQGITLNERFSSEQHYSLTEDEFLDDDLELEEVKPVINRPPFDDSSSDTQIFCKIGSWEPQRRQVPAPGDLRHDLERRRQQKLEGVKITIAGGNFSASQMALLSQVSEPTFIEEDGRREADVDFGWSEQVDQQGEQWDDPHAEMARPNFSARHNFSRVRGRPGPRGRRDPNNGASW